MTENKKAFKIAIDLFLIKAEFNIRINYYFIGNIIKLFKKKEK